MKEDTQEKADDRDSLSWTHRVVDPEGNEVDGSESALIRRGDRFPHNLFLVLSPGLILFPDVAMPIPVRDERMERTLTQAQSQSEFVGFVVLEDPDDEAQGEGKLMPVGVLARIGRSIDLPNGTRVVVLQGLRRFRIERFLRRHPYRIAKVSYPEEILGERDVIEAMSRSVRQLLRQVLQATSGVSEEMGIAALNIERPGSMADFAAAYFVKDARSRRALLAEFDVAQRLRQTLEDLTGELHLLNLGQRIQEEIREKIEKRQHEFFLREQLKAIRRELGEEQDELTLEIEKFKSRIDQRNLPDEVKKRAEEDLRRLRMLSAESPEAGVLRGYLDALLALPFGLETTDRHDLGQAREVLDRDHAGLDEVKERILEFLAVRQRRPGHRGQILCFAGPPGVGKTSLGRSIATALGRNFVRISLGGIHDEAEIRGHRRTYIGAQAGRVLRGLRTAGSMNPVFMLDELDKVGQDFRGDPSAALLEVLDPEQNFSFSDHYIEVPVDLSHVFFIATANDIEQIPGPLRDRLEVISLAGYTTEEKVEIARQFLLPRMLESHGLTRTNLHLRVPALRRIALHYTREAGVRALEKCIARVCRKVARQLVDRKRKRFQLGAEDLDEFLGPAPFTADRRSQRPRPGVVQGLAWTPFGGEVLEVEALLVPGSGERLLVTGMLGEVMKESTRIALSFVQSQHEALNLQKTPGTTEGIHVHVPAGAVRKDGPSAGIAIATALASLLSEQPVRASLAMTGELTLTGRVLPVGGIREKTLAARRSGIREVIFPRDNQPDVQQIPEELVKGMAFHFVEDYAQVAPIAFSAPARKRSRGATRTKSPKR